MGLMGESIRRLEDQRFLTGTGRYMADIACPGALVLRMVRSPHAHAVLRKIDTAAACALPGVAGVFTAADLAGLGPIPCTTAVATVDGPMRVPLRFALPSDRVRYAGEPVAFVIAATEQLAWDAAELVEVDYDPLPCVVEAADALADGAPLVWDDVPGNCAFRFEKGNRAAVAAAIAGAAQVIAVELVNNRLIIAPIEHRGALAAYDPATSQFSLILSGQGVHGIRKDLAEAVFRTPLDRLDVSAPDVGGGFGVKNGVYPEYIAALWAARQLGRPVRWQSGHGEDFLTTAHGRDNVSRARLALDASGKFLALDVETVANLGAGMATGGPGSSTNAPGNAMGGGYDIPAVFMSVRGAFTNTVPLDAYRGAGKPEAAYIIERLVDEAARQLGLDRIELRRRNLITEFPHRTAVATTIDGGRFAANIDPALAAADSAGFAARRDASVQNGRLRGLGITCFLENRPRCAERGRRSGLRRKRPRVATSGLAIERPGARDDLPANRVRSAGLPIGQFDYVQADTRTVRNGNGHGGARSLHMGGAALVAAIEQVLAKARPIAARLLQAGLEEVSFDAGRFSAGERSVGLIEVAGAAGDEPIDTYHWNLLDLITFPNGCHVAEVEVDPETGVVTLLRYTAADDFGAAINPLLLIGQVQGGVAQGIGQALLERTVYDKETGQLLTGSFMDYALPRAADLPDLEIHLHGVPTAANKLGVKGAGQAGAIAAPPAVMAAVLDALAPLGVTHLDMPLTPERVWQALQRQGQTSGS